MKTIDTRGHLCPMPIIMVKSAINQMETIDDLHVLTDNEISKKNLLSFFNDNNHPATAQQIEDYWVITVGKSSNLAQLKPLMNLKKQDSDYIVVLKNNKMGFGNDDLGEILIKGFFNSLCEIETPPAKLIFYNAGVLLTQKTSVILPSLQKISEKQVEIFICGACVDFYKIKEEIGIGNITNMLNICEMLSKTTKVIYP